MGHLLSVSMVGLRATSSKRAYATPRTATPRAPAPAAGHCWPIPPQEMRKHSKACLVSFCGVSWSHTVLFEPSECLWQVWSLILNTISPLLPSCWGFSFTYGCGASFFGGIQHSPVHGCSAVSYILEFSQEKLSTCPSTLPFCHFALKIYQACPPPSEQDPVFPTVSSRRKLP